MSDLVFVAGARPNFMKIAPILRALEGRADAVPAVLVHTGQHYDTSMSDVFFEQLGIRAPDVHLEVGSGTHGAQTARIITAFEEYLLARETPPYGVVVVGDVNSTMGCTLVAAKLHIPVAHVEAGLRSGDRRMPEEINRVVTDAVADLLMVSEPDGLRNLKAEGIPDERVVYIGNVMIDSLVHQLELAKEIDMAARLGLEPNNLALVTLHRPSNVDTAERLGALVDFLARVAERIPVVFPVHPRTNNRLEEFGLRDKLAAAPGVKLLEPLGYRENLSLMQSAKLVISDSGGIQEETTYLGVPCVTLRPNTERPVTVTEGTNTVVGEDLDRAWAVVTAVLEGRGKPGKAIDGWDGRAGERVIDALIERWVKPA
jgi:UDP-N-acetylglucosamine 2-epimerase (non-hydrolysing)